jgi:formylglycine-generating enzyme
MRSLILVAALHAPISSLGCTVSPHDSAPAPLESRASASPIAPPTSSSHAPPPKPSDAGTPRLADPDTDADAGAAEVPACPPEMVRVGRFCIDAYEAHLVIVDGTEPRPAPFAEPPRKGLRYEARSARGVTPQPYVSRLVAAKACTHAQKRLCTLGEWQRACRGAKRQRYPYGLRLEAGRCNSGKPHLMRQLFGEDARRWKYDEHFNSPVLSIAPGYLAHAGSYSECVTEDGAFDMVGNLHEWVAGMVDEDLVRGLEREDIDRRKQSWRVGNGIFMGGFFSTRSELGPGCEYITIAHEPGYHDYSTGFRCCKTATDSDQSAKSERMSGSRKSVPGAK